MPPHNLGGINEENTLYSINTTNERRRNTTKLT
jgi:hypothetical protein